MRYLCLLYVAEDAVPAPGTPEFGAVRDANMAASAAMAGAGVLVDSAPLRPVRSATTIRIRDDETLLTDGPYAELKEQLGGYYLLECANLDDALRWAATIPAARIGSVEVRPVVKVEGRD
ncbi:MAG TPA: YciI family protein [Candidatus Dormibacteraeota bacterium]